MTGTLAQARMPRRVCVATTSRADYGPLYWLLHELHQVPEIDLRVLVSGAHLSSSHGNTETMLMADGLPIAARVDMLLAGDSPVPLTKSMGVGLIGLADALDAVDPDIQVVLGDRYEILLVAAAALMRGIPLAHIAGGQVTEGAFDESIRHAVTKLAHLHFVSTEDFRRRVIQLGEDPDRVWTVGALGLDQIRRRPLLERDELETELGHRLGDPTLLVTYHPATRGMSPVDGARELITALDRIPRATVVFTATNADPGGQAITKIIGAWTDANPTRAHVHSTLGSTRYLSLMREADVVVGNSSSGLIEAPALHTPTVNIGDRQRGRPTAAAVISCPESAPAIVDAIGCALTPEFRQLAVSTTSPYGDGHAAPRIREVLANVDLDGVLTKRFHDLPVPETARSPS
jgi:UDP-hydrolysing UDP-N-acetyl-D-glucosamine 2-epimerase